MQVKPWAIDAREAVATVRDIEEISDDIISSNHNIREMLQNDRYLFIVATKGFGKSLLLLYKRKLVEETFVIPQHLPLDIPQLAYLSSKVLSALYEKKEFTFLWKLSLTIPILKKLQIKCNPNSCTKTLQKIMQDPDCVSMSSTLSKIIHDITRKEFLSDLSIDYGKFIFPEIQSIKSPVYMFIDNIDECFEEYELLWYKASHNLVKAAYDIMRSNPKIKIFIAVRREVFDKYQTEMLLQYKDLSLIIFYTKDELKEMFIKNIFHEREDVLIYKDFLHDDPITAFIGDDQIQHGFVNETENIFDYIYRHTLQRPRDLMEIGGEISRHAPSSRDLSTREGLRLFKRIVNSAASNIANQYINEVLPHISITRSEIDKIFSLIKSNILSSEQIKKICADFNGNNARCFSRNCKDCYNGIHIFCELYKIGLLGYVEPDPVNKNKYYQKFASVGESTFEEVRNLPASDYYLLHPIVDELIRQRCAQYKNNINTINIVGYDREWMVEANKIEPIDAPILFISSTLDLKNYRDIIESLTIKRGYKVVRGETISSHDSLKKCKRLARDCDIFVALMGPRYGQKYRKKSISEHEFEAAYDDNPDKIIVYLLKGNIDSWDKDQQKFVDKVQSISQYAYARGARINELNIKSRFEQNLTEKVAELLRK